MTRKLHWGHGARVTVAVLVVSALATGCGTNGMMRTEAPVAASIGKQLRMPWESAPPPTTVIDNGSRGNEVRVTGLRRSPNVSRDDCVRPYNQRGALPSADGLAQMGLAEANQLLINVAVVCSNLQRFGPAEAATAYFYAGQAYRAIHDNPSDALRGQLAARQAEVAVQTGMAPTTREPLLESLRLLDLARNYDSPPRRMSAEDYREFRIRLMIELARVHRRLNSFDATRDILATLPPDRAEVRFERAAEIIERRRLARFPSERGVNNGQETDLANAYDLLSDFTRRPNDPYLEVRGPANLGIVAERLGDGAMKAETTPDSIANALKMYDAAALAYAAARNERRVWDMRIRRGHMYLRRGGALADPAAPGFRCTGVTDLPSVDLAGREFEYVINQAKDPREPVQVPVDAAWGYGCAMMATALRVDTNRNVRPALAVAVAEGFAVAVNRIDTGASESELLLPKRQYYADYAKSIGELARATRDTGDSNGAEPLWQAAEGQWSRALRLARDDDNREAPPGGVERHRYQAPILLEMARMSEARGAGLPPAQASRYFTEARQRIWMAVDNGQNQNDLYPVGDRWQNTSAYLHRGRLLLTRFPNDFLTSSQAAEPIRANLQYVVQDASAPRPMQAEAYFMLAQIEVELRQRYLDQWRGQGIVDENLAAGNGLVATRHAMNAYDRDQTPWYRTNACMVRILFRQTRQGLSYCSADQARDGDGYAESLLRQGMFHLRESFNESGGDQARAWALARDSFDRGLRTLSTRPPSRTLTAPPSYAPDMRTLLQYGREMAEWCGGMRLESFPGPGQDAPSKVFARWGIDNCSVRR